MYYAYSVRISLQTKTAWSAKPCRIFFHSSVNKQNMVLAQVVIDKPIMNKDERSFLAGMELSIG
jgi:hypothetical protein